MAGWTGGAGVRAALTMGDGVERGGAGAGQSTQPPAGHTSQERRRAARYLLISHRYCSLGLVCPVLT